MCLSSLDVQCSTCVFNSLRDCCSVWVPEKIDELEKKLSEATRLQSAAAEDVEELTKVIAKEQAEHERSKHLSVQVSKTKKNAQDVHRFLSLKTALKNSLFHQEQ